RSWASSPGWASMTSASSSGFRSTWWARSRGGLRGTPRSATRPTPTGTRVTRPGPRRCGPDENALPLLFRAPRAPGPDAGPPLPAGDRPVGDGRQPVDVRAPDAPLLDARRARPGAGPAPGGGHPLVRVALPQVAVAARDALRVGHRGAAGRPARAPPRDRHAARAEPRRLPHGGGRQAADGGPADLRLPGPLGGGVRRRGDLARGGLPLSPGQGGGAAP